MVIATKKATSQSQLAFRPCAAQYQATTPSAAKERPMMTAPMTILMIEAGSRPLCERRVHRVTRTGVKRNTTSGLSDWNQVLGMKKLPMTWRSTPSSVQSAMVLPFCS